MNTKIKLLSDWNGNEKGAVVEVESDTATQLVSLKIAEDYKEEVIDVDLEEMVKNAVTEAINKSTPKNQIGLNISVVKEDKPKSPFKSLGHQLIDIANGGTLTKQWMNKTVQGQAEGTGSLGGYLIADDYANTIWSHYEGKALIAPKCTNIPIKGFNLKVPSLSDYNRSGGAVPYVKYRVAEGATKTPSTLTFEQISLSLLTHAVVTYATDELLEDANALERFINMHAGASLATAADYELINGNNTNQFQGLITAPATIRVTRNTSGSVVTADVVNMYAKMLNSSLGNAEWYCAPSVLPQLLTMTIGQQAIFFPPNGNSPFPTLLGKRLNIVEHCPVLGYRGDLIFADFSQYVLADKASGIKADKSIHVEFLTDQTCFRFVRRVDAEPMFTNYVTLRNGDTVSPYVILDDSTAYQSSSSSSS